jgi:hypothetical protein
LVTARAWQGEEREKNGEEENIMTYTEPK